MAGMQELLVGRRVKLTLEDGLVVSGFLHSHGTNDGKLSLEKVECIENGSRKKLVGLQHYFADEITDVAFTEEVYKSNKKKIEATTKESQGKRSIIKKKVEPAHLSRLENVDFPSLILKSKKQNDLLTSSGNETGSSSSEQEVLPQSDEYTIISKLSHTFYEAIAYINKFTVIAMSCEGVIIGRQGKLCWLQIAVSDHIFLFDVLSIGQSCFDEGLKDIIENADILKVLHDCRMVSDMLHHQYNIRLVNVFDTQVANVFVYRLKHQQDWPRYVDGLSSCLVEHLRLNVEDVNWSVVREGRREEQEMVWTERPPQRHVIEAAVKNIKHLLELRLVLTEKMMAEFVAGVNIYLMHVRDANAADASRFQATPHLLPYTFLDLSAFLTSYDRGRRSMPHKMKDENGFRDNSCGITHPNVNFSRDSVWHAGRKKPVDKKINKSTDAAVRTSNSSKKISEPSTNSTTSQNQESLSESAMKTIKSATTSNVPESVPKVSSLLNESSETQHKIASRRNLNSIAQIEAVNQAVAQMTNASVLNNKQPSKSKSTGPTLTQAYDLELQKQGQGGSQGQGQSAEESDQEMSGSRLMRALVYEQDKAGYECNSGIDQISMVPAGKLQNRNIKPAKKSRHHSQELTSHSQLLNQTQESYSPSSHNYPNTTGYRTSLKTKHDNLEQVIPGGDLVTRSPQSRLSQQERTVLENMQKKSPPHHTQYDSTGRSISDVSDTETVQDSKPKQPSAQMCSALQMQLTGRKSSNSNQSTPAAISDSDYSLKSTNQNHTTSLRENQNGYQNVNAQQYPSPPAQQSSSTGSKLELLMAKLRNGPV